MLTRKRKCRCGLMYSQATWWRSATYSVRLLSVQSDGILTEKARRWIWTSGPTACAAGALSASASATAQERSAARESGDREPMVFLRERKACTRLDVKER